MRKFSSFLVVFFSVVYAQERTQFRVFKEWDFINFTWPDVATYNEAVRTRTYIPENIIVAGVMYYNDYYYLSLPRMRDGVPATIARIPSNSSSSPALEPYPSWQMNKVNDCDAVQNSQNIEIDTNGQMWIIDIGRTSTLNKTQVTTCPPKLIIYDIGKNKTTRVYHFPEEVAGKNSSFLYDLVIDDIDGGYAYITDNSGKDPGIIVYSLKLNKSWKVRHSKTMKADPAATNFKVDGIQITVPISITGIALGPKIHVNGTSITITEDRPVYYCPLSSTNLYSIQSSFLRNESSSNNGSDFEGPVQDVGRKASQTDGMIMDDTDTLYYGLLGESSVARWNTHTPFAFGQRVISRDAIFIQWPNSFTFDNKGNIVLLTNRLHKFVYGRMNINEPNFRLMSARTGTNSYLSKENPLHYEPVNTTIESRDVSSGNSTVIPSNSTLAESSTSSIDTSATAASNTSSPISATTQQTKEVEEGETKGGNAEERGEEETLRPTYDSSSLGEEATEKSAAENRNALFSNISSFEPGRRNIVRKTSIDTSSGSPTTTDVPLINITTTSGPINSSTTSSHTANNRSGSFTDSTMSTTTTTAASSSTGSSSTDKTAVSSEDDVSKLKKSKALSEEPGKVNDDGASIFSKPNIQRAEVMNKSSGNQATMALSVVAITLLVNMLIR